MKSPSKAQATILAWAIHRGGGRLRSADWAGVLDVTDATVVAMVRHGWAEHAKFYDDARQWRWWWFFVTEAARTSPLVLAEVAHLKAGDEARAKE